jgi:anaerobic ribonucleoside-triphosphate reductase activating protein
MSVPLTISRIHFPVTTLGPGRRLGIWFQGCTIRCKGCISADTWGSGGHATTDEEVLKIIAPISSGIDGVTITGGEPFEQPAALQSLLAGLRRLLPCGVDILVYSGFSIAAVAPWLEKMKGMIDALISEPFDELATQTRAIMGSDNQRLSFLTPLGHERFLAFDRVRTEEDNQLDLCIDDEGIVWMSGIPRKGDFRMLEKLLRVQGYMIRTSEDARTQ